MCKTVLHAALSSVRCLIEHDSKMWGNYSVMAAAAAAPFVAATFATGFRFVLPGSNLMYDPGIYRISPLFFHFLGFIVRG